MKKSQALKTCPLFTEELRNAFPGIQTERTNLQLMLEISKDKQTFVTVSLKHTDWCLAFMCVFQQFTKEVTAALDVRPGIQKKLTYHLHTPPYSVFLICITTTKFSLWGSCRTVSKTLGFGVPHTGFRNIYALATYCFSKHVFDQWIPSKMLFQACSLTRAFCSYLNKGSNR